MTVPDPTYNPPPDAKKIPENASQLEINLDIFEKYNSISAVYFLVFENEIVYVGMTKNLLTRVLGHLKEKTKVFDSIFYIETEEENLMVLEKLNIENAKPFYNKFGVTKKYPTKNRFPNSLSQRTCIVCCSSFSGASHGRYCSDACKQKAYRERLKRNGQKDIFGNRICAYCGNSFDGALYARYCSNAHKQAAHRARKKNQPEVYA